MKNSAGRGGCYPLRPKHPPRSAEFFISYENLRYHSKYLQTLKGENELFLKTFRTLQQYISPPGFLGQWFNYLQQAALLTSSVEYDKILCKFGQQQLLMVNDVCGFNQSETRKYFE